MKKWVFIFLMLFFTIGVSSCGSDNASSSSSASDSSFSPPQANCSGESCL